MSSVRSPASSACRGTTVAHLHMLVTAIAASSIAVPDEQAMEMARPQAWRHGGEHDAAWCERIPVATCRFLTLRNLALDPPLPAASWASRFDPADIDGEVLRWIAAQAKGKRPLAC